MPEFLATWLGTLTDDELDKLLFWFDGHPVYEEVAEWIDKNRLELSKKLFGNPDIEWDKNA